MPADWTRTSIGDCLSENFTGEWGTSPNPSRANALVLRSTNLDDDGHVELSGGAPRVVPRVKLAAKRLRDGDILLEASGGGPGKPVGRVAVFRDDANGPYLCSNFFRTLRPDERTDSAFLGWRLLHLHRAPEIWHYQQQTTGIINLKHADYFAHEIELPPLPEQRRIAEILDTLDEAIRRTEQVIAKLQQMKQGLLHDLLTRGIDEHGELRDPERHPEQFKDSPLGRIPRGWDVARLGTLLDGIDAGKSPSLDDTPARPGEWGVLKVSAVRPEGFRSAENKVVHERRHINPAHEVRDGDLLITRANTAELVGLTCIVQDPQPQLLLCDKTLRLHVGAAAGPRFVFYATQMAFVRHQIEANATGSSGSMKNISQAVIRGLLVPCPSVIEQRQIVSALDGLTARLQTEVEQADKLRTLKHGLMHDLLTGRVRTLPTEATA